MIHYIFKSIILLFLVAYTFSACSNTSDKQDTIAIELMQSKSLTSGQNVQISYEDSFDYNTVITSLKTLSRDSIVESYGEQEYSNVYTINRFLNKDIDYSENYYLEISFLGDNTNQVRNIDIDILPSIIIESFCASNDCQSLTGNVVQNTINTLNVSFYKIAPIKIEYIVTTPYDEYKIVHDFTTPVTNDWVENLIFNEVPDAYSSYINTLLIKAYDSEGNHAETALPFKVVRPIEVKHFGKYELAETYEPVPVTGCIPGSIGNNVRYTESQSETRQNSVSITLNNNWTNSNSSSSNLTQAEGINISETENTIRSSSLSESETFGESETNAASQTEQSNISFSSNDGETWSWNIGESETQGTTSSSTESNNTGVNGSVTTGFTGEGSLPFLAKVSGRVDVTAGVTAGWGNANSEGTNESNSSSRGYSTGGSSQSGRSYGTATNDSRSHSLTGTYVLSSSTSNTITESSGTSSGRVWNMSESIGSGRVVTEGNSESLAETIIDSSTSSTTFSYSAYIPRGRYGIFYRQTSRYVKLSEVITYDLNGFPLHGGYISMNSWAWAPELSVSNSCDEMLIPNLPAAACHIPPCGE